MNKKISLYPDYTLIKASMVITYPIKTTPRLQISGSVMQISRLLNNDVEVISASDIYD